MKSFFVSASLSIFILISFNACQKGDDGPQGPPGTANVIYSAWFTASPYVKDTVFGIWGFNYVKTAPEITQAMLDSGAVFVFAKLLGYNPLVWPANQVGQMPISISYNQGGVTTDTWSAQLRPGSIRIRFVNDRNIYTAIATQHQFRYIFVAGGEAAGRMPHPPSYEELCSRYNIPE